MKKFGKVKKIVTSVLIAGLAVGVPAVGAVPSTAFAADADSFTLKLRQSEGGSVITDAGDNLKYGEVFTLSAVPDEGYRFLKWNLISYGYHDLIEGDIYDADIKIKVGETSGNLFSAEPIFIKDDLHVIRDGLQVVGTESARAGETISCGMLTDNSYFTDTEEYQITRSEGFDFNRVSDGASVKADIYDPETHTFIMPDYDIIIGQWATSSYHEKVLSGLSGFEETSFAIENASNHAIVPDKAKAGETIEIGTVRPDDPNVFVTAYYSIYRADDGTDVTSELLDNSVDAFIMPDYDIRIETRAINIGTYPLLEEESVTDDNTMQFEKVLSSFQGAGVVEEKGDDQGEANASGDSDYSNKTDITQDDPLDNDRSDDPECLDNSSSIESDTKTNEKTDKSEASAKPSAVSTSGIATQASVASIAAYSPAAVRMDGSSTVSAKNVSSPATGDYNITTAFSIAAIVAGTGIVAAAVVIKRRYTN